jgi:hypothetical protein
MLIVLTFVGPDQADGEIGGVELSRVGREPHQASHSGCREGVLEGLQGPMWC